MSKWILKSLDKSPKSRKSLSDRAFGTLPNCEKSMGEAVGENLKASQLSDFAMDAFGLQNYTGTKLTVLAVKT